MPEGSGSISMTLITFVLSAIGVLLNPAGGGTAAPAGIVGPIR